jgi:hypothetical protein
MLLILCLLPGHAVQAAEDEATALMQRSFDTTLYPTTRMEASFVLTGSDGQSRERHARGYSRLNEDGINSARLTRFTSPANIAGTSILSIENSEREDDVWVYLPALRKVRRLAAAEKRDSFAGTDFSHGDVIGYKVDAWRHTLLRKETLDGVECAVVESVPGSDEVKSTGYGRRVSWIRLDNGVTVHGELYDEHNELLKRYFARDLKEVDAATHHWQPMELEMKNVQSGMPRSSATRNSRWAWSCRPRPSPRKRSTARDEAGRQYAWRGAAAAGRHRPGQRGRQAARRLARTRGECRPVEFAAHGLLALEPQRRRPPRPGARHAVAEGAARQRRRHGSMPRAGCRARTCPTPRHRKRSCARSTSRDSAGDFDVRVGRQIAAWGRADRINPTDNLTSRDLSRLFPDDDDLRRGNAMLRVDHALGENAQLQLYWIPEFRPEVHPLRDHIGPFAIVGDRRPDGVGQGAVKIDGSRHGVDWSVSYFDGHDPTGDLRASHDAARPFDLVRDYPRQRTVGADMATVQWGLNLRAEAAYSDFPDRERSDLSKRPFLFAVLGGDRNFGESINLNLQYILRRVTNHAPPERFRSPYLRGIALINAIESGQRDDNQNGASMRLAWTRPTSCCTPRSSASRTSATTTACCARCCATKPATSAREPRARIGYEWNHGEYDTLFGSRPSPPR